MDHYTKRGGCQIVEQYLNERKVGVLIRNDRMWLLSYAGSIIAERGGVIEIKEKLALCSADLKGNRLCSPFPLPVRSSIE